MTAPGGCGRSDCRELGTVEVLARSESGRLWVARSCEPHWAETLEVVAALGFVPVGPVTVAAGVSR